MANRRKTHLLYFRHDEMPDHLERYRDHWRYIQHVLISRRWHWLDERELGPDGTWHHAGVVTLLMTYLEDVLTVRAAHLVMQWALESGHLIRAWPYEVGNKGYGYVFGDEVPPRVRRANVTNPNLLSRLNEFERRDCRRLTVAQRHLRSWLKEVEIDDDLAFDRAVTYCETSTSLDCCLGAVDLIRRGLWTFSVCDYGRCHSNLTRLAKVLRPCLLYGGRRLVSVDISNSQPLLLAVTMCSQMGWVPKAARGPRPIHDLTVTQNGTVSPDEARGLQQPPKCQVAAATPTPAVRVPDDVLDYIDTCQEGVLYERLMEHMGWAGTRDEFKDTVWFHFLYGSNKDAEKLARPEFEKLRTLNASFQALFPTVYDWVWRSKRRYYAGLSCDMQRRESAIMIDAVGYRLREEHPDVPVWTVHDSYMTTGEHLNVVVNVIREEFRRLVFSPNLAVEEYDDQANDHRGGAVGLIGWSCVAADLPACAASRRVAGDGSLEPAATCGRSALCGTYAAVRKLGRANSP